MSKMPETLYQTENELKQAISESEQRISTLNDANITRVLF